MAKSSIGLVCWKLRANELGYENHTQIQPGGRAIHTLHHCTVKNEFFRKIKQHKISIRVSKMC